MSSKLPNLDLTGSVVGSAAVYDYSQVVTGSAPSRTLRQGPPHLLVQNESPYGLTFVFLPSGVSVNIPAGFWGSLELVPDDNQFRWSVDYELQNALVFLVLLTYYSPGEQIASVNVLGNSPINGGVAVTFPDRILDPSDNIGVNVTDLPGNFVEFHPTANNRGMAFSAKDNLGNELLWMQIDPSQSVLTLGNPLIATTLFQLLGDLIVFRTIQQVAQVNTTGGLGVPLIVAEHYTDPITATTTQTLVTITTPTPASGASGIAFRGSGWFRMQNGTTPQNIGMFLNYSDAKTGGARQAAFMAQSSSANPRADGTVAIPNGFYAVNDMTVYAAPNTPMSIVYRDPGGTPGDSAYGILEQLTN